MSQLDLTKENIEQAIKIELKEFKNTDKVKLIYENGINSSFTLDKKWRTHPDYKSLFELIQAKIKLFS